ncbi:MAG TPA: ABC transporter permease [Acidimicrobiales bacterium]|nr:ABC transporter permease [Acidimicrobiales bacterium]
MSLTRNDPPVAGLADGARTASASPAASDAEAIGREVIAARRRRSQRDRRKFLAVRLVSLAVVFGAWQLYGMHTIAILFAPITTVVHSGYNLFAHAQLGSQLGYSMWTFAIGYLIGVAVGIAVGMLMGAYRVVEAAVSLYVFALYATPMVALVPIMTLWIGFDATAQIVIIALFVTWPMIVTVFHGVRQIDAELMEVSRSLRLNRRQTWVHVLLPGAVPFVITGATQGVAMGLVGVIIAELQTQLTGLGAALQTQAQTYHTAGALAVVLLIMVLGVTLRAILGLIQRFLVPWMRLDRGDGKRR